jgi:hypothetical protein
MGNFTYLLLNPVSELDRRIDPVLYRGGFTVREAAVVGDQVENRTPSGFWPSDHAGVVATLKLPHP